MALDAQGRAYVGVRNPLPDGSPGGILPGVGHVLVLGPEGGEVMTWDVVFSEQQVFNPDYGIMGIPYVAIIAPDGTVRHAGLHPGDPKGDIAGKVEAILKEFNLPLPTKG